MAKLGLATFGREDAIVWADAARQRIASAAGAHDLDPRLFACTLLVAVVDERRGVFFQVGDGAIVYRHADGGYRPALWPHNGEYANCTWFLTDEDLASRVESTSVEDVHEIALLTDGLQALALRFLVREAHGPFFEPMFARLRRERGRRRTRLHGELRAFLESPAVNRRTDDDKTLVLATRLPATLSVPSVVEVAS
jgi:Protein phosphatase 2C